MKTRLVFLGLLFFCFSCGTNNKPLSDAQKEKIKGEVKEVVDTFFKGIEEVNPTMAAEPLLDSPDFVFILNGRALSYKELVDGMTPNFSKFLNQKVNILDEKYAFLDESTVLYTNKCTSLTNYKDGHVKLQDPTVILLIFKKISNTWKIIYGVESFIEKSVNSESSKGLNQVELMKQLIGSWEVDGAIDTIPFYDLKPYGNGIEGYFKYVTKGKIIMEGKQLWGYDKKIDKYYIVFLPKGQDMEIWAAWFTSKNKWICVPYNDISNPDNASVRIDTEFKSADMYVQLLTVNNKPVKTDTYKRIK